MMLQSWILGTQASSGIVGRFEGCLEGSLVTSR